MSSPSHDLSLQKSKSVCEMSTSLRERLKKCGRYHPGSSPSAEKLTNTTPSSANRLNNPDLRTAKDTNADVQKSQTCSVVKSDIETPKRKKLGTLNTITHSDSDLIKRRKLHCAEDSLDNNNISDLCQSKEKLSSSSYTQKLLENYPNLEALRETEISTIESSVSSASLVISHSYESSVNHSCLSVNRSDEPPRSNSPDQSYSKLKDICTQLESDLKVKEEQLRKLKMVKMYREKNNLTELQRLINIWRDVSQRAIVDLHNLHPSPKPSLTELVNHLQIDHELVHYVADDELFS